VEHPARRRKPQASDLKGTRWAVLKNPGNLTGEQRTTIATIAATNNRIYRAYLLKEQLRAVFATRGKERFFAGFLSHGASEDGGRDDVEESFPSWRCRSAIRSACSTTIRRSKANQPAHPQGTHPRATGKPAPEDHPRLTPRRRRGLNQLNS
jgi:hypothetical protein